MEHSLLDTPDGVEDFDALLERRTAAERRQRRINRAYGEVGGFIVGSTRRASSETRGKVITALPEDDLLVLALADSFALISESPDERFLQGVRTTPEELQQLWWDVEQAAVAIDPTRAARQPSNPLPQA